MMKGEKFAEEIFSYAMHLVEDSQKDEREFWYYHDDMYANSYEKLLLKQKHDCGLESDLKFYVYEDPETRFGKSVMGSGRGTGRILSGRGII